MSDYSNSPVYSVASYSAIWHRPMVPTIVPYCHMVWAYSAILCRPIMLYVVGLQLRIVSAYSQSIVTYGVGL